MSLVPVIVDDRRTDFQGQYQAAITRLDDIIANIDTYTNAQLKEALKDLARIQRRTLRMMKRLNNE